MQPAAENGAGRDNGQASQLKDDVPRLRRWLAKHPDAEYIPPDANFRVRFEEVEVKALQLGLLVDKLEALDQAAATSEAEARRDS
jgi:hypothetical protein